MSPLDKERLIQSRVVCEDCGRTVGPRRSTDPPRNCSKQDEWTGSGSSSTKLKELLNKSLAVLLMRVVFDSSPQTAEKILTVLRDECFDLDYFRHIVTDLKKCEEITRSVFDNNQ